MARARGGGAGHHAGRADALAVRHRDRRGARRRWRPPSTRTARPASATPCWYCPRAPRPRRWSPWPRPRCPRGRPPSPLGPAQRAGGAQPGAAGRGAPRGRGAGRPRGGRRRGRRLDLPRAVGGVGAGRRSAGRRGGAPRRPGDRGAARRAPVAAGVPGGGAHGCRAGAGGPPGRPGDAGVGDRRLRAVGRRHRPGRRERRGGDAPTRRARGGSPRPGGAGPPGGPRVPGLLLGLHRAPQGRDARPPRHADRHRDLRATGAGPGARRPLPLGGAAVHLPRLRQRLLPRAGQRRHGRAERGAPHPARRTGHGGRARA